MKSILVIEDNKEIRENTAELLGLNGYQVFTAVNGKVGFKEVKSKNPDLILCDIMMPETDGKEFFKLVKNDETTRNIPLIFFSAGSAPSKVKKGLIEGADGYLRKPFTEQELLDIIQSNIDDHKR